MSSDRLFHREVVTHPECISEAMNHNHHWGNSNKSNDNVNNGSVEEKRIKNRPKGFRQNLRFFYYRWRLQSLGNRLLQIFSLCWIAHGIFKLSDQPQTSSIERTARSSSHQFKGSPVQPIMIWYVNSGFVKRLDPYMEMWHRSRTVKISSTSTRRAHRTRSEEELEKIRARQSRDAAYDHEPFETDECVAMHEWQKQIFTNCNAIHEMDMSDVHGEEDERRMKVRFVNNGGFRDVWMVREWDGTPRVLKTLVYRKEFDYREMDRHRRDAIVMSQLSSSRHIPNIYGYCVNSGLFDFANSGDLENHIFSQDGGHTWTDEELLRYAWQVAKGLADVHAAGGDGRTAISHTDVAADQYLWMDGMYKLNDFNRARFIRWNTTNNEPCTFEIAKSPGKFRSPEEYAYVGLSEKVDTYQMGNIFYSMLTKNFLFEHVKTEDAQKKIMRGERPHIPNHILYTSNPYKLAIMTAIEICQTQDPKKRASASDVELFLRKKLEEFKISQY